MLVPVAVALLVLACGCQLGASGDSVGPVVARVNGEPIPEAELGRAMTALRARVLDGFRRERGASWSPAFWQTEHAGERPLDVLREQALSEVVRSRIILRLAAEHGLLEDPSYEGQQRDLASENARRSADQQAGLPVYGPVALDERRYAELRLGTLAVELQERLADGELSLSEAKLRDHYEAVKSSLFRLEDTVTYTQVTAAYSDGAERLGQDEQRQLRAGLETLRQRLDAGAELEEALAAAGLWDQAEQSADVRSRPLDLTAHVSLSRQQLEPSAARTLYKSMPELYRFVSETGQPGEASEIADDPQRGIYALAIIHERRPGGYESYEQQRDTVRKLYLQEALALYIDSLVADAEIELTAEAIEDERWLSYVGS